MVIVQPNEWLQRKHKWGLWEGTWHLRTLAVKPGDVNLIPGTHVKVKGKNQLHQVVWSTSLSHTHHKHIYTNCTKLSCFPFLFSSHLAIMYPALPRNRAWAEAAVSSILVKFPGKEIRFSSCHSHGDGRSADGLEHTPSYQLTVTACLLLPSSFLWHLWPSEPLAEVQPDSILMHPALPRLPHFSCGKGCLPKAHWALNQFVLFCFILRIPLLHQQLSL